MSEFKCLSNEMKHVAECQSAWVLVRRRAIQHINRTRWFENRTRVAVIRSIDIINLIL